MPDAGNENKTSVIITCPICTYDNESGLGSTSMCVMCETPLPCPASSSTILPRKGKSRDAAPLLENEHNSGNQSDSETTSSSQEEELYKLADALFDDLVEGFSVRGGAIQFRCISDGKTCRTRNIMMAYLVKQHAHDLISRNSSAISCNYGDGDKGHRAIRDRNNTKAVVDLSTEDTYISNGWNARTKRSSKNGTKSPRRSAQAPTFEIDLTAEPSSQPMPVSTSAHSSGVVDVDRDRDFALQMLLAEYDEALEAENTASLTTVAGATASTVRSKYASSANGKRNRKRDHGSRNDWGYDGSAFEEELGRGVRYSSDDAYNEHTANASACAGADIGKGMRCIGRNSISKRSKTSADTSAGAAFQHDGDVMGSLDRARRGMKISSNSNSTRSKGRKTPLQEFERSDSLLFPAGFTKSKSDKNGHSKKARTVSHTNSSSLVRNVMRQMQFGTDMSPSSSDEEEVEAEEEEELIGFPNGTINRGWDRKYFQIFITPG